MRLGLRFAFGTRNVSETPRPALIYAPRGVRALRIAFPLWCGHDAMFFVTVWQNVRKQTVYYIVFVRTTSSKFRTSPTSKHTYDRFNVPRTAGLVFRTALRFRKIRFFFFSFFDCALLFPPNPNVRDMETIFERKKKKPRFLVRVVETVLRNNGDCRNRKFSIFEWSSCLRYTNKQGDKLQKKKVDGRAMSRILSLSLSPLWIPKFFFEIWHFHWRSFHVYLAIKVYRHWLGLQINKAALVLLKIINFLRTYDVFNEINK